MLKQEVTAEVTTCGQHRRRIHGEHRNGVFVNLTRRIAFLVGVVVDQQRMVWIFSQPLRGDLAACEVCVNVKPLVHVFTAVNTTCEACRTVPFRVFKVQRRIGVFHKVVAVCTAQGSQTINANCRIGGVVLAVAQIRITLCSGCAAEGGWCRI